MSQIAEAYTWLVGGLDPAQFSGWGAANEIAYQLAGRAIFAAAQLKGLRLQLLLQLHSGQWPAREVLLRVDANHDAGIGVALVAGVLTHAVGHDTSRLRRRGHDGASRAHAEAVDRTAIPCVMHQLVVGGAELRVACVFAETGPVNQGLWVLDTEPDGEGLGFDEDTTTLQHPEGIAGTVARCQYDMTGAEGLITREHHCLEAPVLDQKIGHFAFETHLT